MDTTLAPETLELTRLDDHRWLLPRRDPMRVDGIVYADDRLIEDVRHDESLRQVANVACLPGIVGRSIGMPDIHWGYGFPIGGVAAFDPEQGGVVSPGGVGYDINCGVRLLRSDLTEADVRPRLEPLMNQVMRDVPSGVGSHHRGGGLPDEALESVLTGGVPWAVEARGWGVPADLARIESGGVLPGADPSRVSARAMDRGRDQLGSVGSGNHFIEVGYVDRVFDEPAAAALGLEEGTVTVLIHSGSRGLGHQVCTDYLEVMLDAVAEYGIALPDRQLACAPLDSPQARDYLAAMAAAANFAFVNRQRMAHLVRGAFERVLERRWEALGLGLVYDVAHNNAKWETHLVDGRERRLCVHRKGATRAFPPGHPDLDPRYAAVGQPVLIPGDMGRYSYVLVGTRRAFEETFGSCCHGAGRRMSRTQARKAAGSRALKREFRERGIEVRAASRATIAEELPESYKDVAEVVEVVHRAGIGRKVARLRPMGVLKG
ncbi:MAG: RtcB family protein [Candidatus Palauibacterales bacterium]|nr:RtcB family protein [Candidatus Palauibacterales bacterium]MDP2528711.1 RtcB family protein [Candidatus Palauibacterales bacterium]MDP2585243.1 RtcB family protein [Candidatus Palauibacterales bacterium]